MPLIAPSSYFFLSSTCLFAAFWSGSVCVFVCTCLGFDADDVPLRAKEVARIGFDSAKKASLGVALVFDDLI